MTFTSLEIIALVSIILSFIKIITFIVKKKAWYNNVTKKIYGNTFVARIIFIFLALIIFYFLMEELNIIQIFVTLIFSSLFLGLGFTSYTKEFLQFLNKIYNKKLSAWMIFLIIVWFFILSLVFYEIFF